MVALPAATALSTTISNNGADVVTIEHIMSALAGIGVDNAIIEIDNREVPILDGSARLFVEALVKMGLKDQGVPRRMIEIPASLEVTDPKTGSRIRIEPADSPSADITVDFGSDVLGVQSVHWDLQRIMPQRLPLAALFASTGILRRCSGTTS